MTKRRASSCPVEGAAISHLDNEKKGRKDREPNNRITAPLTLSEERILEVNERLREKWKNL